MASIVLCVEIDVGGGNVRVSQIVPHGLEVHAVALVGACGMAQPRIGVLTA